MNVQIQGGGSGAYANSGSSRGVVSYLEHEDKQRLEEGKEREQFFSLDNDNVAPSKVAHDLDNNKGQLGKKDAKFYVITVSPSQEEIKAMGKNRAEQVENFKEYINRDIMQKYAENFNKDLSNKDIKYYAKIHHTRGDKKGEQLHAHIIVSRKDIQNKKKLSPQTNHRGTSKGAVKGGFDRNNFRRETERSFDNRFLYKREFKKSFDYQNTIKNGTAKDAKKLPSLELEHIKRQQEIGKKIELKEAQEKRQNRGKNKGLAR